MEKLHERCIRFIYKEYDMNYFQLLKAKNLKTLFSQRINTMCCEIFKTKRNLNAGYMKDLLADRPSKYANRRDDDIYVPKEINIHLDITHIEWRGQNSGIKYPKIPGEQTHFKNLKILSN